MDTPERIPSARWLSRPRQRGQNLKQRALRCLRIRGINALLSEMHEYPWSLH